MAGVLLLERGYIFRVFDGKKKELCKGRVGRVEPQRVRRAVQQLVAHLRIIWLNHDKHRKAAGDDVEKDDCGRCRSSSRAAASEVAVVVLRRAALRSCTRSFWAQAVRAVFGVRLLHQDQRGRHREGRKASRRYAHCARPGSDPRQGRRASAGAGCRRRGQGSVVDRLVRNHRQQ